MAGNKVGRPKKAPAPEHLVREVLPYEQIFTDDELQMYRNLVNVYLEDFEVDDLTSSDMDDIMDLAKNRILEFRLLKESKGLPDRQLDTATAIEKLSKKNEKIKESLSSRRKDRINPNELKGFSIVDLAVAYDEEVKTQHKNRLERLRIEEEEIKNKRKDYVGNRYDTYEDQKDGESE